MTADSAVELMERLMGRSVPIENYSNRTYLANRPAAEGPAVLDAWQSLTNRHITTLSDVTLVAKLLRAHPDHSEQVLLRHVKDMNVRDFKTGNFIVHGGFRAQPWAHLFEQQMNFGFGMTDTEVNFVRNARPQTGERPSYTPGYPPTAARLPMLESP